MKISGELATSVEKTPAQKLQAIFQDKDNTICGGSEVRDELTRGSGVGGMRTTNWDKALRVADAYLDDVAIEIPKLTKEVKQLEEKLASAEASEALADKTIEDMTPILTTTISKPGTMINVETAKASNCGKDIKKLRDENREIRKQAREASIDPVYKPVPTRDCFKDTLAVWGDDITAYLVDGARASSDVVLKACNAILGLNEKGIDLSKTYCDELCTQIAGHAALNAVEFMGGTVKSLRAELEEKAAKLKELVYEQQECDSAKNALQEFKDQLDGLNAEIDRTFAAHQAANDALLDAEDEMDEMHKKEEDNKVKIDNLVGKLTEKNGIQEGLAGKLKELKDEEPNIKALLAAAVAAFKEATTLIDNAMGALTSFAKLKILVASTVAKMWTVFQDGVLTPLDNLGIEKSVQLHEYFEKKYESNKEYGELMENLEGLDKHCASAARPAFLRVEKQPLQATLLDMCEYKQAAESGPEFAATVLDIGDKMLVNLQTAQAWHDPLTGHPELTPEKLKELMAAGEIANLRTIENAFGPSDYFKNYLSRWKADSGDFLKLLSQLSSMHEQLEATGERLGQAVSDLKDKLSAHQALKRDTFSRLQAAIEETESAQQAVILAKDEQNALNDEIDQAEQNLAELYRLLQEAEDAWVKAQKVFEEEYKKGTNM